MSKFCVKCGTELEDEAIFCDDCGAAQPNMQQTAEETIANSSIPDEREVSESGKKQSGFGIAALVLGILSILSLGALLIPEILGIVFGVIGLAEKSKKTSFALAGIILSIISFVLFLIIMFV